MTDARALVLDASNVAVALQLTGDAGRFHAQDTLMLTRTDHGWRIVDQQQGDHPSIRAALAAIYVSSAKSIADTVPAVLERQAATLRVQATQQ